ncbi:Co-chaperone Hsc20 [Xylariaceae sp. FL1272]|nr:Co-chaperone Hsc20 [Xylariaceae sp. FL1272]
MRPPLLTTQSGRICAHCRLQRVAATRAAFSTSSQARATPTPKPRARCSQTSTMVPGSTRPFANGASQRAQPESTSSRASHEPRAPMPQTHYDFFPITLPNGPPPKGAFDIDVRTLRREFLALQAEAHPDLHPQHMKARAEAMSARINEAFKTLESPLLRSQYLLALRGLDVANDETAKVEDPELLMLVLETREIIEEALEEGDLEGPRIENEQRMKETEKTLAALFEADDLEGAKAEVVRLRYWVNIQESIRNWEKGKPIVLEH